MQYLPGPEEGAAAYDARVAGSESHRIGAGIEIQVLSESTKPLQQLSHLCSCWLHSESLVKNVFMLWSLETSRAVGSRRIS